MQQQVVGRVGAKTSSLQAVVYPACVCGAPWPKHLGQSGCYGYMPSRQIRDLGTIMYRGRWLCVLLWKAERVLTRWRERLEVTS